MQLDYTLSTPEARIEYVNQIIAQTPSEELTPIYLTYLSNYILFTSDKNQTKKERKEESPILTKNREITINKRQVSFEEIVSNLENGEDGLYALISDNKNQILDPRTPFTDKDYEEIPELYTHYSNIQSLQEQLNKATGSQKYYLKKAIIETWQQMYLLKTFHKAPSVRSHINNQIKSLIKLPLDEEITIDENALPQSNGILTLLNPFHISYLLSYYSKLKEESYDDLQNDLFYLLLDLEDLVERTLPEKYPLLYDVLIWKIDGLTNSTIQEQIYIKYKEWHTEQYYSSLWRKRIPNILVEQAQKDYLIWYYTNVEKGYWKKCSKCGEIKLGHHLFFPKNTSKDGWYSWCKDCRSQKGGK